MRQFVFSLTAVQPHRQHKLARLWSQGQRLQHMAASCVLIFLFGEWTAICFQWPIASVAECRITLMDPNLRHINSSFSPCPSLCHSFLGCQRSPLCWLPAQCRRMWRREGMLWDCLHSQGQGGPGECSPPFCCASGSWTLSPHPQSIPGACSNNN